MKYTPYISLGEAIEAFLDKHGLRDEADIQQVIADWEAIMGRPIALHTRKISFRQGVLLIQIDSPVWKQELQLARSRIRTLVNTRIGREVVQDVRIV
ncbi:MAG: hypothetical protein OHK0039_05680 [Bacteroidia bacterium]